MENSQENENTSRQYFMTKFILISYESSKNINKNNKLYIHDVLILEFCKELERNTMHKIYILFFVFCLQQLNFCNFVRKTRAITTEKITKCHDTKKK